MVEVPYHLANKRVFVAGHKGMVGQALVKRLASENIQLLTIDRAQVDLRNQFAVTMWFKEQKPQAVFLAAARVGGIVANDTYPADFLYDNLMIEANIIQAAHLAGVEKLLFLGSSCIYPKLAPQPLTEEALLTGPLEETNQWYAIAKIAGIKLCQAYRRQHGSDFIAAMPTNLYGYGDLFNLHDSHVIPALMRKIHAAKTTGGPVEIWGTGKAWREFLFSDDLADALVFLMQNYSADGHLNVGTGKDLQIRDLAALIAEVVGYNGEFFYDASKPDGTPRKLMDVSKLAALGWQAKTGLREGLAQTYAWFVANEGEVRK
jgi:GDP-L-fucose synthase